MTPRPPSSISSDRSVGDAYDAYRSSLERSLDAARRHDQLTQRLHAIDSAHALVRLVFGLEGQQEPAIDELTGALAGVERAQAWPAGYLRWALLNLVRDPAPKRQLELARRVERLLSRRRPGMAGTNPPHAPSAMEWPLATGALRRAP